MGNLLRPRRRRRYPPRFNGLFRGCPENCFLEAPTGFFPKPSGLPNVSVLVVGGKIILYKFVQGDVWEKVYLFSKVYPFSNRKTPLKRHTMLHNPLHCPRFIHFPVERNCLLGVGLAPTPPNEPVTHKLDAHTIAKVPFWWGIPGLEVARWPSIPAQHGVWGQPLSSTFAILGSPASGQWPNSL